MESADRREDTGVRRIGAENMAGSLEASKEKRERALNRKTLSEQIYAIIKQDILNQRIRFGEKLVNRDLQLRFGVSSTPVRDAVNHLHLDGLVQNISNKGAEVITFETDFALDVNEVVMVITFGALRGVFRRNKQKELAKMLRQVLAKQEKAVSMDEYILLDQAFHQSFFTCCANAQLNRTFLQYATLFELLVHMSNPEGIQRETALEHHRRMCDFAEQEDRVGLEQVIAQHYTSAAVWIKGIKATAGRE